MIHARFSPHHARAACGPWLPGRSTTDEDRITCPVCLELLPLIKARLRRENDELRAALKEMEMAKEAHARKKGPGRRHKDGTRTNLKKGRGERAQYPHKRGKT